jgi:hypothetical protein
MTLLCHSLYLLHRLTGQQFRCRQTLAVLQTPAATSRVSQNLAEVIARVSVEPSPAMCRRLWADHAKRLNGWGLHAGPGPGYSGSCLTRKRVVYAKR